MLQSSNHEPLSYDELDRLSGALGFVKSEIPQVNALVYDHKETGASLILVKRKGNEKVPLLDLFTFRRTVIEKGVASAKTYNEKVLKAKQLRIVSINDNQEVLRSPRKLQGQRARNERGSGKSLIPPVKLSGVE